VEKIAAGLAAAAGVGFVEVSEGWVSPADQLVALVETLAPAIATGALPEHVDVPLVLGPSEPPPTAAALEVEGRAFRDALVDVRGELRERKQVPSTVFVGTRRFAPADFLVAVARAVLEAQAAAKAGKPLLPARVAVPAGTGLATETRIAADTPGLFGGWIIHEEGFRAPKILEMARLQAWTLKPAGNRGP
jgi:hypothetical protein